MQSADGTLSTSRSVGHCVEFIDPKWPLINPTTKPSSPKQSVGIKELQYQYPDGKSELFHTPI
jgi:hypothetical protein